DVFFLREKNLALTEAQKSKLAQINSLLGGVLLTSDDPSEYSDETMKKYRALLKLRSAENIRVEADNGICIKYVMDGIERRLDI
ncbi:MAG: alpha-galactosidase, partial [Oscillospiraceae bacterium]|nr:alpha-galactosidase [Oscillospiraceae bacterium]